MPGRQTEPGGTGCEQKMTLGGVDRHQVGGRDGVQLDSTQPQGLRLVKGWAWWDSPSHPAP